MSSFGHVDINDLPAHVQKRAREILAKNPAWDIEDTREVIQRIDLGITPGPNAVPLQKRRGGRRRDLEHVEQVELFRLIDGDENLATLPIYAVPNFSGLGDKRHGGRLKAEGRRPGVLDVNVDVARGGYHGLRVELKIKPNVVTPAQREWCERLHAQGYRALVCWSAIEAFSTIRAYLNC